METEKTRDYKKGISQNLQDITEIMSAFVEMSAQVEERWRQAAYEIQRLDEMTKKSACAEDEMLFREPHPVRNVV